MSRYGIPSKPNPPVQTQKKPMFQKPDINIWFQAENKTNSFDSSQYFIQSESADHKNTSENSSFFEAEKY